MSRAETPLNKPLVICYARYSTPEQSLGDSERRQITMADAWAEKRGFVLDETFRFWDRGISAFKGRNESEGELGKLMGLAKSGKIPRGSYLLVENLDRLSRQDPLVSVGLLNRLLECGLRVVTLTDGQEYVSGQMGLDAMMSLLRASIDFYRGHGESERKSGALKKSWEGKRLKAAEKRLTSWCPAWMRPSDQGFELIPERVEVLKRIFSDFAAGKGVYTIAADLRRAGIPPWNKSWGVAKKKASPPVWHKSYLHKILLNPAVIGIAQPYRVDKTVPGHRAPVGPPIEGYFPRAIPADLWKAAQKRWRAIASAETSPSGPRGAKSSITSLFSGLLRCGRTDGGVVVQRKAADGRQALPRLYCVEATGRYAGWMYDDFETAVLGALLTTDAAHIWPATQSSTERADLHQCIAEADEALEGKNRAISALLDSLEGIGESGAATIKERISLRSDEKVALEKRIKDMQLRLDKLSDEATRAEDSVAAVRQLFAARRQKDLRDPLRSHIRDLVSRIDVYFRPVPRGRELAVMQMAQKARKLLRLATIRRKARKLGMEDFTFRKDDKKLWQSLWLVRRMQLRQWAEITFKSGVKISTRGTAPGLRLAEAPGWTVVEGDGSKMRGYSDFYRSSKVAFIKGYVPLEDVEEPTKGDLSEARAFFESFGGTPNKKTGFTVVSPKSKERFPGT